MTIDVINNSIAKHLDELKAIHRWVIIFTFIEIVLALQSGDKVTVLNIQLTRTHAFFVTCAIYILLCLGLFGHLKRISFLLSDLPDNHLLASFKKIDRHPWIFNPFVVDVKRRGFLDVRYWGVSAFAFSFCWCWSALYMIDAQTFAKTFNTWAVGLYSIPITLFMCIVLAAEYEVVKIYNETSKRIEKFEETAMIIREASHLRHRASIWGGVCGLLLVGIALAIILVSYWH